MKNIKNYWKSQGKIREKSVILLFGKYSTNTKNTGKVKEKSGKNQSFFFLENILQIQQKLEKSGSLSLEHFSKVGTMYLCLQNKTVLCVLYVCPRM